ncbi:hypothetical protein [Hyphomonas sp.]|uniref:hypothetical protein n=1 Tax=Hyphomonas sp. TaxID=87 RepID=UPI001BCC1E95|nr:hypothetical protein [Hyphomonas sp.]
MLKYFAILAASAAAACSQPGSAGSPGEKEAPMDRYVITVSHEEGQAASQADMDKVVAALQQHEAHSVEVLEGLPTIIVTAAPDAIEAARQTGLVEAVQSDSLSAPQ